MQLTLKILFAFLTVFCVSLPKAGAAATENRFALVVGNASYKKQPLASAANDAALIAQTLQSAGFDVVGARDLDQGQLRKAVRDFTDKVVHAGRGATIVVYFSGYAVQSAGENYLIPIGTEISDVADLPARTSSLSELMHELAALNSKLTFVIVDAARQGPFVLPGLAGGLAWTEPEANMLVAFNSAPGTLARDATEGFSPYAKALAEMIREGDLIPAVLFDRVRLRVHELTKGAQIPWSASKIDTPFKFFEGTPSTPARIDAPARTAQLRFQPMRALGAQQAYMVALMRDTFDAYTDFLAEYWQDAMTKRVRALLAARRESIIWRRTCETNHAVAYRSYLEIYPLGPHTAEANRLLTQLGAATTSTSKFVRMDYDVPPPLPDELEYVQRPALFLDDPAFGFEPPPPTPANFLQPPPKEILNLQSPAPSSADHALPVLNLPLQTSLRITPEVKALPNPSNNVREAWVIRPAIDVPGGPARRAETSPSISISGDVSGTHDLANEARSSSRIADEAPLGKNKGPISENRETAGESTSRFADAPRAVPARPQWFSDIVAATTRAGLSQTSITDSKVGSLGAPSMFTLASAGLTFQTWHYASYLRTPVQTAPPAALARPRAGLPGQAPSAASPVPQTTATVPSTTRLAPHVPRVAGSSSRLNTNVAPPLATAVDRTKPRKKPAAKPVQSTPGASTSNEVLQESTTNPQ